MQAKFNLLYMCYDGNQHGNVREEHHIFNLHCTLHVLVYNRNLKHCDQILTDCLLR